jgi:hypothetical protein
MSSTVDQSDHAMKFRQHIASLNDEALNVFLAVNGIGTVVDFLIKQLDDTAKKNLFEGLKADYPELWP